MRGSQYSISSRLSRYNYELRLSDLFDASKGHLEIDRWKDEATDEWRADNQMAWLLKRACHSDLNIKLGKSSNCLMIITARKWWLGAFYAYHSS